MAVIPTIASVDALHNYSELAIECTGVYLKCLESAQKYTTKPEYLREVEAHAELPESIIKASIDYAWYTRDKPIDVSKNKVLIMSNSDVFLAKTGTGIKIQPLEGYLSTVWLRTAITLRRDDLFPKDRRGWMVLEVNYGKKSLTVKTFAGEDETKEKVIEGESIPGSIPLDVTTKLHMILLKKSLRALYKELHSVLCSYRDNLDSDMSLKNALAIVSDFLEQNKYKNSEEGFIYKNLTKAVLRGYIAQNLHVINASVDVPSIITKKNKTLTFYCKGSNSKKLNIPGFGKFNLKLKHREHYAEAYKILRKPHYITLVVLGKSDKRMWYYLDPVSDNV